MQKLLENNKLLLFPTQIGSLQRLAGNIKIAMFIFASRQGGRGR